MPGSIQITEGTFLRKYLKQTCSLTHKKLMLYCEWGRQQAIHQQRNTIPSDNTKFYDKGTAGWCDRVNVCRGRHVTEARGPREVWSLRILRAISAQEELDHTVAFPDASLPFWKGGDSMRPTIHSFYRREYAGSEITRTYGTESLLSVPSYLPQGAPQFHFLSHYSWTSIKMTDLSQCLFLLVLSKSCR